ncbi:MAG TPA: hypothetical protein VFB76_17920 [Candidatus Angelobacter sp.]|nr:hypothetical protein [Candidatus Angelobacter sp.]
MRRPSPTASQLNALFDLGPPSDILMSTLDTGSTGGRQLLWSLEADADSQGTPPR